MSARTGPRRWRPGAGLAAGVAYTLLAVVYTWPLAAHLATGVPWDLGDALLNDWILGWHYHQAARLLAGDWAAAAAWWHPPIFHPAPYALAYSELLISEAVLGAPVFVLTGNLLLTYNVLFIASFALSAGFAFLLMRELTGDARAAWLAGLLYGFALYRVAQAPHLQVLHAQWAPLVLYGLHRYFAAGRWRAAVGAGLALAAQNLANGYYLFYLALLLPPYVVVQIASRGRLRDWRAWAGPGLTALVAAIVTVPCMYPYLRLRQLGDGARPLAAVVAYGADTYAWLTASEALRLWGWLRTAPRPEGELFPGILPVVLALLGLAVVVVGRSGRTSADVSVASRVTSAVAAASLAWHTLATALVLGAGVQRLSLGPATVSFGNGRRLLVLMLVSAAVLAAASRRARQALRDTPHAPVLTLTVLLVLTVWLAYGPVIRTGGRVLPAWPDAYSTLYALVPGADALRVPPRIAMMTALLGAMLAGIGLAALGRRGWLSRPLVLALSMAITAEAWIAPIPMNLTIEPDPRLVPTPATVPAVPALDPEAAAIAALPADAVIVELPIGSLPHEIRWQYLAAGHWRPRLNGYSGGAPDEYVGVEQVLGSLPDRPDEAAALLAARGVTDVVLRPAVWRDRSTPDAIRGWLRQQGAARVPGTPETIEESGRCPAQGDLRTADVLDSGPRSRPAPRGRDVAGPARHVVTMRTGHITPSGRERFFGEDEIIVSKTDLTGKITYANGVFLRISGFTAQEILGQPHSVIRHPDMPRSVFKLLWTSLEARREIFAYVCNLAVTGDHYWVFAHVTPTFDTSGKVIGYHSNRRVPDAGPLARVKALYADLVAEERRHSDRQTGLAAGSALLDRRLGELGMPYDELVFSL